MVDTTGRRLTGPAGTGASAQVFVVDLEELAVEQDDLHHLGRVLRLRPGEPVVAADGAGSWRLCSYRPSPAAGRRVLQAEGTVHVEPEPPSAVTVGFVPVKGVRPEWVVQKLTELGVDDVAVLRSSRAVVRWQGDRTGHSLDRLRRVARQAAAQSRRARIPSVDGVWALSELSAASAEPLALAHPGGAPPEASLRSLAVGPEGGWEEAERAGHRLVGLGPGVLRADTAALAAATILCSLRDGRLGAHHDGPPAR